MSWPVVKLKNVAPAVPCKMLNIRSDELIWQLTLDHIEPHTGRLLERLINPYSEAGSSTHAFDERYVLYSKLRPYLNKVVLPDRKGICTTELVPMLPDPKRLNRKYLAYYLRSQNFLSWVSTQTAGAKMPRVSMKVFWEHNISLPPLSEQKRIAAILDKADQLRRQAVQMEAELNLLAQSVFLDMFGDPVTNPKGWDKGVIRDLVSYAKYGTSAKASESEGEFPILRMNNITYVGGWDFRSLKYINLSIKDQEKYLVHAGELLFNRTNSKELVGKTAVYREKKPMAVAGYLVRVGCNEHANSEYIAAYMNSAHGKVTLQNMCKSIVGMANINAQEFQDIEILKPPKRLQDKFAGRLKIIREKIQEARSIQKKYEMLFGAISQKAFKGELDLNETEQELTQQQEATDNVQLRISAGLA